MPDGIFFAGGDQPDYVRAWKDSAVEDAVNAVIARTGAIGRISAGLAILGQFLFSAEKDTDPVRPGDGGLPVKKITLERDILDVPMLSSAITNSHLNEDSAALVTGDWIATVVRQENVLFVKMRAADVESCAPGAPPGTSFVDVHVILVGSKFDVATCSGDANQPVRVRVKDGALHSIA